MYKEKIKSKCLKKTKTQPKKTGFNLNEFV